MAPQSAYNKLVRDMDIADAPHDSNVIHNTKKTDNRKQRNDNGQGRMAHFADERQTVMNMVHSDGFVQRIELSGGHIPSVIVYSDRQICDVKSFCFGISNRTEQCVLGFDKTYNLGSIYVTPSVFKNPALVRRHTGDSPLFLGPIFIYGHSDFHTYSYFF